MLLPAWDEDTGAKMPPPASYEDTGAKMPLPVWDEDTGAKMPSPVWDEDAGAKMPSHVWDEDTGAKMPSHVWDEDTGAKMPSPVWDEDTGAKMSVLEDEYSRTPSCCKTLGTNYTLIQSWGGAVTRLWVWSSRFWMPIVIFSSKCPFLLCSSSTLGVKATGAWS